MSEEYQNAWLEKMELLRNVPDNIDILEQIGQNGSRGGEGVYLTSRPYEWSNVLADQGIDLGENVYAIYLPEGVEEYMQVAGNDILLPEAVIDGTKAKVLGKVDINAGDIEFQANELLKNYKNK